MEKLLVRKTAHGAGVLTFFQHNYKSLNLTKYTTINSDKRMRTNHTEDNSETIRGTAMMEDLNVVERVSIDKFHCNCDQKQDVCDLIPYELFHTANLGIETDLWTLHVDGYFGALMTEILGKSDTFQRIFFIFVRHLAKKYIPEIDEEILGTKVKPKRCVIVIVMRWPKQLIIDFKWYSRVAELIWKHITLEECMAWLSTLGGGYSSMGDHCSNHAETAGRISVRQFQIAMEMADPIMQSKCILFRALSMMQRGQVLQAKHMIKKLYRFIKKQTWYDECLILMCQGVWSKLQFFHKQKKIRFNGRL